MKKKSTLEVNKSKLANYSAVAGAVLASGAVNAQIQYTDVDPDAVINTANSPYNLDFNGDSNNDVILGVTPMSGSGSGTYYSIPFTYTYQGAAATVQAGVGAAVMGSITGSSSTFSPSPLDAGVPIDAAGNFGSGGALGYAALLNIPAFSIVDYPVANGAWLGVTDKFLGARLTIGGNIHYGWVRMDVAADATTITVKDYAYNSVATDVINAGQMLDLSDVAVENKVTIKTQLDQAFINVTPDLVGGEIAMVDMSGKEVLVVPVTDILTTVKFEGMETGIYMLNARFESGSVNKKVYVK